MAWENRGATIELEETQIESDMEIRARIIAEFEELGLLSCPPKIVDHFFVLEKHSKFNNDSRMIREGLRNVLAKIEAKSNGTFKMTTEQMKKNELSALVHDIGKTSSSEDLNVQLAVVRLFDAKRIKGENQKVLEVVEDNFLDEEVNKMLFNLSEVDVTPDMTIRAFWDKHAFWTKEILDRFPDDFNQRMRWIAASHHLDRGINPYGIQENEMDDELKYSIYTLMAIDKYQAMIVRGEATHEKAMVYLRKSLEKFSGTVMDAIIETMDELGRAGELFPETQKKNLASRKG